MDTNQLIELLGGRAKVIKETGLSPGRISQWTGENHIPTPWLRFFRQKYKSIPWHEYAPSSKSTPRQNA